MFWMLPLAGAAAGALMSKKDPLKGALMGAALGATGGALAPGLLAGGAAAGGAATAAGAAGATGAGASVGAGASAAGAGAAGAAGGGAGVGSTMAASTQATAPSGLLSGFSQYADPAMKGISAASQAQGLLNPPEAPIQGQPLQSKPVDFSGLLSQRPQGMSERDRYMQRLQMMQGGYRG